MTPDKKETFKRTMRRKQKYQNVEDMGNLNRDQIDKEYNEEREYERNSYPSKRGIHNKVRNALFSVGNVLLFNTIDNCFFNPFGKRYLKGKSTSRCGSVYCAGCRNRIAIIHFGKVKDRLDQKRFIERIIPSESNGVVFFDRSTGQTTLEPTFNTRNMVTETLPYSNENLQHISGVLGICPVKTDDVQRLVTYDKSRWRRINRRLQTVTDEYHWIEIAYELELVNWDYLKDAPESDTKKRQVKFLIDKTGLRYLHEPFLYVHFHGITSLSLDSIQKVFNDEYFIEGNRIPKTNRTTGLYIQSFHKNKSLKENVTRITSYPFKNAIRYKHSFRGSDYTAGEPFTYEELGRLITIVKNLYGRQGRTLFRSFSNERRLFHTIEKELYEQKELLKNVSNRNNKNWILGKQYSKKELQIAIARVTQMITKLNRDQGNTSKKQLTKVLQNETTKKELNHLNPIWWKLEMPYPKSSRKLTNRVFDGIWKHKENATTRVIPSLYI